MHFQSSKKNCYRFPSTKSLTMMDKRMYFPEKPNHATYDSHNGYSSSSFIPEKEHSYDFK